MQKTGILNSEIAKVLADMGHTDQMTIGDCGLPVPSGVKKIDLALRFGQPSFIDVVSEVAKYMKIEKIYVAPEMEKENPKQWKAMHEVFPETEVEWVVLSSHEEFKKLTVNSKAVIRTVETTPFSNVVLQSACIF